MYVIPYVYGALQLPQFFKCMKSLVFAILSISMVLLNINLTAQDKDSQSAAASAFADKSISLPVNYEFDKSVQMELVTSDAENGESSKMVYTMRYHDSNNYIGMTPTEVDGVKPNPQANVMVDFERMHMITFMNTGSSMMAFVYEISEDQMADQNSKASVRFEKTENEKEMFGYICFEYLFSSPEAEGRVWVAPELEINIEKSFEALGLQFEMGDHGQGSEGPKGFIIEFDLTTKSTGERAEMQVLEVDLNDRHSFSTEGYVATSMTPAED